MLSFLIIAALLITVFLLGYREKTLLWWPDESSSDSRSVSSGNFSDLSLGELADRIHQREQETPHLVAGAEKLIQFADPEKPSKTRFSVIYIHGFSACRQEISPVPERVANCLGANFYATRLTGHGTSVEALGDATPDDWIEDVVEAWHIATCLGEKVIIMATSTGATLATWMAQQQTVQAKLASLVLVAPNYRPNHKAIGLFLWPWARYWLPLITGPDYGVASLDELEAKYWTVPYPIRVLFGVVALSQAVYESDVACIKAPTLFIYCDADKTVYSSVTEKVIARWGATVVEQLKEPAQEGSTNHVIAGNIFRPQSTDRLVHEILNFIHNSDDTA